MENACVIVGDEKTGGAAFAGSGCGSIVDFLLYGLEGNASLQVVQLSDGRPSPVYRPKGKVYIEAEGARAGEEGRESGSFANFLRALPSCSRSRHLVLESVKLASEQELSALCSGLGAPNCIVEELLIENVTICESGWTQSAQSLLKTALFNNTSLRVLSLHVRDLCYEDCLIPRLTRPSADSIQDLTLYLVSAACHHVSGILTGLAHNTISLKSFCMFNHGLPSDEQQQHLLSTMLRTNTFLQSLALLHFKLSGWFVRMLFSSLEQNAHLCSLSLDYCWGSNWPPASFVLDCLRVNGVLRDLRLRGTPIPDTGLWVIHAQLARNKQRVHQLLPSLKAKGTALVPPTTLRLFLCGFPYSGKTTLSRSLVEWNKDVSRPWRYLACTQTHIQRRTRGIEVSTLENDGVKVSLWDLAGQPEYYAFHDHMFPNFSSDATPSLFLFVWNPISLDATGKEIKDERGKITIKTLDMFELEFRYWLRFISSKTLKSLKFKPTLIVVMTRADLLPFSIRTYIQNAFNKCKLIFKEHIQFYEEAMFNMDARDPCEVNSLGLYIFHSATSTLRLRPPVYGACNQIRMLLAESHQKKALAPLVPKQELFLLCRRSIGLYEKEIFEAVALSLNESGDLIYFKELELVVVDTQWFCERFMGELLYFSNNTNQQRGFFPPQYLEELLESEVNTTTVCCSKLRNIFIKEKMLPTIKGEALVKLLVGLRLACPQDDGKSTSDIFIPVSLCSKQRTPLDPGQFLRDGERNMTYVGRRMRCKDSVCTFFTPGIFSVIQVTFHKLLHDRKVNVQLQEDIVAFAYGGVKVFMEFCRLEGTEHVIDILAASSKESSDETIEWLQKNVINDVERICAEPRGIQGVELTQAIIQQSSIRDFFEANRRPAVLLAELQDELKHHVQRKGVEGGINAALYTWQTGDFPTSVVVELIGKKEASKVIQTYFQDLSSADKDISNVFVDEAETSQFSRPSPLSQKPVFGTSASSKERGIIYDKLCEAEENVMKKLTNLELSIEELHKAVEGLRSRLLPKLSKLFTFVTEGEAGKFPRTFIITEDDGHVRRLVLAIVPGLQSLRLLLLCECRSEPFHRMDRKWGMSLARLDEGLLKRSLPYINAFLKVAWMATRIGAHVAIGFGNAIPDFSRVLDDIGDVTTKISQSISDNWDSSSLSRVNFKEGQQWLFDVLSNADCLTGKQIYEVFGLQRVRLPDASAAWVCDTHYREGEAWPA